MEEDSINFDKFQLFVGSVVDSLIGINNELAENVIDVTPDVVTIKSQNFSVALESLELFCNRLMEIAGLPPVEVNEISFDSEEGSK